MNRHAHITLRRNAFLLLVLAGLFALTGISRSTSMLPPYHEFYVNGKVLRAAGPPLDGYTVGLFFSRHGYYELGRDGSSSGSPGITLTDDRGEFRIRVRTYEEVDSVTTGVILPGDTLFSAAPFAAADVYRQQMFARGEIPSEGSCDSSEPYEYVEGYVYTENPEQLITVP